jgi:hypothetical protein
VILVFVPMLAGSLWSWRQGYAALDITTVVWPFVLVVVLLMHCAVHRTNATHDADSDHARRLAKLLVCFT